MEFQVAIPSYNRQKKLRDQTLALLESEGFDPARITIFVADEEERKKYEEVLKPGTYSKLVVGVLGLAQQRNFIQDYYPQDELVLQLDDDIKKVKMLHQRPLIPLMNQLFAEAKKEGCNLWGIYPVNNLFYCKERVIVGKMFIVGCFWGMINKKDFQIPVSIAEDKWRTLFRYVTDGATLRYEGMCPDTVYNAKGGLYEHRNLHFTQETRHVLDDFPTLCHLKTKKNGKPDIHWKPQTKKIYSLYPADDCKI